MKSLIKLFTIFSVLVFFSSCDKYFDVNEDPNRSTLTQNNLQLSSGQLYIGNAIGDRLFSQMNVWCQYNTGGPGVALGDWDKNTMSAADANQVFRDLYRSSSNLKPLLSSSNPAYKGIAQILIGHNYMICADLFGNIPVLDALNGDITDGSVFNPNYDDAASIVYPEVEKLIEAGRATIASATAGDHVSGDLIYGGDLTLWEKFANTILLRLYTRLGDAGKAKLAAVAARPLITSNSEMAKISYPGGSLASNPFWQDAKSTSLGNFYIASLTALSYLQANEDPRIDAFYNPGSAGHLGLKQGDIQNAPSTADYSRPHGARLATGGNVFGPEIPVILASSWETNLLLAEAAAKGSIGGSAATYYDNGVAESFNYMGLDTNELKTYLTNSGAFNAGSPIKSIALQKWICMNNLQPVESWIETRRVDNSSSPIFASSGGIFIVPTSNVLGGSNFPSILFYPENEQALNSNFPGQHTLLDKVFWDK
ncbi:MAG: SusD/RagB family nutrient-binding outer membrane lipoprotein [Saprospiraceae bacterium]|nr:SusD/RagB family nutrient-binding outer membrane lipoprotein [Saprospiraceae bacterium]